MLLTCNMRDKYIYSTYRKDFYIKIEPIEEVRFSIYAISSHLIYLLACRLLIRCPGLPLELTIRTIQNYKE
jgi:hypothetical protein